MLKRYTVVLRCKQSLFRVPAERGIRIAPMQSEHGDYELMLLQRTEQLPHIETPVPREPYIEVSGPAPSLEAALNIAVASANDYVRQVAFGANAWHGLLDVHLAYESTDAAIEREFFQNWVVDERGLPRVAREIDPDLMYRLLLAIAGMPHEERSRLVRAIVQYTDALQHWKPGSELYALSHLYMGVEALTPLVIRREIAARGLRTRKQLEEALHGPPADSFVLRVATYLYRKAGGYIAGRLEPWARRDVIFRGDKNTYRAAQRASNQLEHGSAHHADIHSLATAALVKTAEYLRETVLQMLQIDRTDYEQLTAGTYGTPLNAGGFERQLLGVIRSKDGQFAAAGQLYPYVRWEFNLLDYKRNVAGAIEMRLNQKIQTVLAPNATLAIDRIVFAGPTPQSHTNVEFDVSKGDKPREEVITKAGAHLAVDAPGAAEWAHLIGSYTLNANAIPHLARFWVTRLDASLAELASTFTLSEGVEHILRIVNSDVRLSSHRDERERLWKEAVSADEVRSLLSAAFTGEKGLVVPLMPPQGKASEITDPKQLRELVDHAVGLVKRLAALLDELLLERTDAPDRTSNRTP
jgi:hypothetical protein